MNGRHKTWSNSLTNDPRSSFFEPKANNHGEAGQCEAKNLLRRWRYKRRRTLSVGRVFIRKGWGGDGERNEYLLNQELRSRKKKEMQ